MTTNHHTPIANGAAANNETFNDPLSELDTALTDHETRIGNLESEFPAAPGSPTEYLNGDGEWTVPAGTGASVDGHLIKDEGVALPQRASIDFVGAGVTVTNEAGGTQVSVPGAHVIQDEGADLPQQQRLNFVGGGVEVTNNGGGSKTDITIQSALAYVLTGLSTATNAVITAADTVLQALGKLQAQITNHDHNGGDGAQIDHTALSNVGTKTHAQIDTHIGLFDTWVDWTPQLYQNGNISSAVIYAQYMKIGKLVHLRMQIQSTAAGVSGNKIIVTNLPFNIANHSTTSVLVTGTGAVLDSGVAIYVTAVCAHDANSVSFFDSAAADFLGASPAWALANNDTISMTITYKEA